ncbi:hypothetical protein MKX07_000045 [Trichoderma sp. CBMAI-0711]|nr:hypothetical protein MKX07_000045 [Trichoderma sp. CBMAI-0711]
MASQYDDAPQLAEGHDLPEAYVSHPHSEQVWSPQPSIAPTYISQPSTVAYGNNETYPNAGGAYSTTGTYSDAGKSAAVGGVTGPVAGTEAGGDAAYTASPESTSPGKKAATTVCGISLVLLLSIIIAILSAAVIGLAAGTGVATKNYNDAHSQLEVLSSSLAAAQAEATATPTASTPLPSGTPDFSNITNGCSDNPDGVTGNTYRSKCEPLMLKHSCHDVDERNMVLTHLMCSLWHALFHHVLQQRHHQPIHVLRVCPRLQRLHGCLCRVELVQQDNKGLLRCCFVHSLVEQRGRGCGRRRSRRLLPQAGASDKGQLDES